MQSMSKSLRASAILIAISIGVPSAALATEEPEPSSTYTLTVPASDDGDGGSEDPTCYASLGLTDEEGAVISEGLATSTDFFDGVEDPTLEERLGYYGLHVEDHLGFWFFEDMDDADPLYFEEIFSYVAESDSYSIHEYFQVHAPDLWKEIDWNRDGLIESDDASIATIDREFFWLGTLVVDWDASDCDDGLSGLLKFTRDLVQMVSVGEIWQDAEVEDGNFPLRELAAGSNKTASAGFYWEWFRYYNPNDVDALATGQDGSEELIPYIQIFDRDLASSYSVGFDFSLVTGTEVDLYARFTDFMCQVDMSESDLYYNNCD